MRSFVALLLLSAGLLAGVHGAAAEQIAVAASPASGTVGVEVTVRAVVANVAKDERIDAFQFIIGPEGGTPTLRTPFSGANSVKFRPAQPGALTLIVVVRFVGTSLKPPRTERTNSASLRYVVSEAAHNPFDLEVHPPSDARTPDDIKLHPKLKAGFQAPSGGHLRAAPGLHSGRRERRGAPDRGDQPVSGEPVVLSRQG